MSLRIYTNISAIVAHNNLFQNDMALQQSIERMSSGLRINHAADDAAGSAIVTDTQAQVDGLNQASQNAQDGVNLVQTVDGALAQAQGILQRARVLAVQMSNSTYSTTDASYAQAEVTQLVCSLDQLAQFTNFNGQYLLSVNASNNLLTFQVGAYAGQNVVVSLINVSSACLGVNALSVTSFTAAQAAIGSIDAALVSLNSIRATFGAVQNRLEQTVTSVQTTSTNLTSALSRIRDLDVAAETTNLTREQILQQSGISVLSTANQSPQSVLSLLR